MNVQIFWRVARFARIDMIVRNWKNCPSIQAQIIDWFSHVDRLPKRELESVQQHRRSKVRNVSASDAVCSADVSAERYPQTWHGSSAGRDGFDGAATRLHVYLQLQPVRNGRSFSLTRADISLNQRYCRHNEQQSYVVFLLWYFVFLSDLYRICFLFFVYLSSVFCNVITSCIRRCDTLRYSKIELFSLDEYVNWFGRREL